MELLCDVPQLWRRGARPRRRRTCTGLFQPV